MYLLWLGWLVFGIEHAANCLIASCWGLGGWCLVLGVFGLLAAFSSCGLLRLRALGRWLYAG